MIAWNAQLDSSHLSSGLWPGGDQTHASNPQAPTPTHGAAPFLSDSPGSPSHRHRHPFTKRAPQQLKFAMESALLKEVLERLVHIKLKPILSLQAIQS